ncbi:MAG: VOC family protein [Gaiellaceae bacterium]
MNDGENAKTQEAPPIVFRVIVPVSDIEHASRFYAHVLGLKPHFVTSGRHYFHCGNTILACFDPRADGDDFDATPNGGEIYFAVDNLEGTHERAAEAGAVDLGPIEWRSWGEWSFYLADPFGNPLCFVAADTAFRG